MRKKLVLFAGAGASRGVSAEKYPMALDFRKRLPETVTKSPLFENLSNFLGRRDSSADLVDIEHVLWELTQLIDAIEQWTRPELLACELLRTNQISSVTGHSLQGQTMAVQFQALLTIATNLRSEINTLIYDFYSQEPDHDELARTWLPLLNWASTWGHKVDLITTNYDLILEEALVECPGLAVDRGTSLRVSPVINLDRWEVPDPDRGLLTKLHGSVDWKLGKGGTADRPVIRVGLPEFEGDHDKRAILYPGFKGRPDRQPFIAFHEYMRHTVQNATHLVFIGFAFRDEYINEVIENAARPDLRLAVVNPADKLPNFTYLQRAKHFRCYFGEGPANNNIKVFDVQQLASWAET